MNRRQFLQICGCTGAGLIIGISAAEAAHQEVSLIRTDPSHRPTTWMRGSARTGCARLPHAEPPRSGDTGVDPMVFV